MICKSPFSTEALSHNARNQIKKSLKNCSVGIIDPKWLVNNGYNCYLNCCKTHKKKSFLDYKNWKKFINSHIGYSCFDFWGIFIENKLIGYAKCIKIDKLVDLSAIWYDQKYLKYYPIYALIYSLLKYYLDDQNYKLVSNGTRSIAHDTKMQEFLEIKFNFKKQYCQLNIVYSPILRYSISIAYYFYPIIKFFDKIIPNNLIHKTLIILKQEKIKKSFKK